MPNLDKNLQPTQSASAANVQPTKQAQSIYEWKTLYRRDLAKAQFSESTELYQVTIDGDHWDSSEHCRVRTCITDLYTERHPYMAVGRAVIAFMETSSQSRVHRICICKQIERKPKTTKKN